MRQRMGGLSIGALWVVVTSGLSCGSERPDDPTPEPACAPLGVTADLGGVFSVAPDDVWAVGAGGTVLHYDGCWHVEPSPTSAGLRAVWAAPGGVVFAVGEARTIVRRSASGTWSSMTAPVTAPVFEDMRGVWGAAPDEVWATVGTQILLWNGTDWQVTFDRMAGDLGAVWGRSRDDVYVVGSGNEPDGDYASVILHWNGYEWREGYACNPEGTRYASGGFSTRAIDVWGTAEGSVWATGHCYAGFIPDGYVARGNGIMWSDVTGIPSDPDIGHPTDTIFASSDADVWVSTGITAPFGEVVPRLLHFDGTTWTSSTDPLTVGIADFGGTGPADIWGVGPGGKRVHFDGTSWTASP